ncbi:MAG: hypothetical protein M3R01_10140 [Actinomycetota bacterium]|nr:hypothetical protein [Actinomycetota bacterium]
MSIAAPKTIARSALGLALAVAVLLGAADPAHAAVAARGQYQGPSYASTSSPGSPSGSKPESKLWYADGSWWGVLYDGPSTDHHIFRLDPATQVWQDTGIVVDGRPKARSDVLWDGSHLYVATHLFTESPSSGGRSSLYRFSHVAGSGQWTLDPGYPATINTWKTETLVLAKDSSGQLWATWAQQNQVWANTTSGDDARWGTPFPVPGAGGLSSDDISSVIAFGGNRIGLLWSNQVSDTMHFAVHDDAVADDRAFGAPEVVIGGPGTNLADDHMNLKADASGRVYATTKTSKTSSLDPFIFLHVRSVDGRWSSTIFGLVGDKHTRPIVLLDETTRVLHLFATAGQSGDVIFRKTTSMDAPSFAPGQGTALITAPDVNNATSTKQSVSAETGTVILGTADDTRLYWHWWDPPVGAQA